MKMSNANFLQYYLYYLKLAIINFVQKENITGICKTKIEIRDPLILIWIKKTHKRQNFRKIRRSLQGLMINKAPILNTQTDNKKKAANSILKTKACLTQTSPLIISQFNISRKLTQIFLTLDIIILRIKYFFKKTYLKLIRIISSTLIRLLQVIPRTHSTAHISVAAIILSKTNRFPNQCSQLLSQITTKVILASTKIINSLTNLQLIA